MASAAMGPTGIRKTHGKRYSSGHVCTACDQCYRCKVRCSGEKPICERCALSKSACTYSTGKPLGKPKGSKNKVQRSRTSGAGHKPRIVPSDKSPQGLTSIKSTPMRDVNTNTAATVQEPVMPPTGSQSAPPISDHFIMPVDEDGSGLHLYANSLTDASEPLVDGLPYYLSSPHDSSQNYDPNASEHANLVDLFSHTEPGLGIRTMDWFDTSPTACIETNHGLEPAAVVRLDLQETAALGRQPEVVSEVTSCAAKPRWPVSACLCHPSSYGIITELETVQSSASPLDHALTLARQGLTVVSSYLSCQSCVSRLGKTTSSFLACILILQQVFSCYSSVKIGGFSSSGDSDMQQQQAFGSPKVPITIGELEVEDEESQRSIFETVVKWEIEKGRAVLEGLERRVQDGGQGQERIADNLFRALRDRIDIETN